MKIKIASFDTFEVRDVDAITITSGGLTLTTSAAAVFDIMRDLWAGGLLSRRDFEAKRAEVNILPTEKKATGWKGEPSEGQ